MAQSLHSCRQYNGKQSPRQSAYRNCGMFRDVRGRIHRYYGVELRYVEYGVGRGIDPEMQGAPTAYVNYVSTHYGVDLRNYASR
jgi:hypothetical protein